MLIIPVEERFILECLYFFSNWLAFSCYDIALLCEGYIALRTPALCSLIAAAKKNGRDAISLGLFFYRFLRQSY
jgi:hypothetical protein